MADNSDYTQTRMNLLDYLDGTTFDTPVNRSLIENTYNRYLTKDETVEAIGTVGLPDGNAVLDRQLHEDTIHRQTYQLQPLMHKKVATVDYAMSFKDVLAELERFGVDLSRLDKWADTEQFNFAPPVDLDKLVNYRDYYWYDAEGNNPTPQYITIKNPCAVVTNRLTQRQKDIANAGVLNIIGVNIVTNEFEVAADIETLLPVGTIFDVVGSAPIDGQYTVSSVRLLENKTYITPTTIIPSNLYNGATVTFDTQIASLTSDRNRVCDSSPGWDVGLWDDAAPAVTGEVSVTEPTLLQFIKDNSLDAFDLIIKQHPEYVNEFGDVIVTDARPLWQWLDADKPEFQTFWDGQGVQSERNSWQVDNKWVHKLDLPQGAISKSIRAEVPILEYLPNLQLNQWNKVNHNWLYRADPIREAFAPVDVQPTLADRNSADFLDKWMYAGTSGVVPTVPQSENTNAVVMSTDLASPSQLETLRGYAIQSIDVANSRVTINGTLSLPNGSTVKIGTMSAISVRVTTASSTVFDGVTTITLDSVTGFDVGNILMVHSTSVFNVVLFPDTKQHSALAGTNASRVYVDEVQLANTYEELTIQSEGTYYVAGIILVDETSTEQRVDVGVDPAALEDDGKSVWDVRTTDQMDDAAFIDAGRPTVRINATVYFRMEQSKKVGEQKIPLFDLFYPDGTPANKSNAIFFYQLDQNASVNKYVQLRLKTEGSVGFYFDQLLIDVDNGPTLCYKDLDSISDTNPQGLQTIWRTDLENRYVPKLVDVNRRVDGEEYRDANGEEQVAHVDNTNGDWEIIHQHTFNAAHENRKYINTTDLTEHIKTILLKQETLPGFMPSKYNFRLLEKLNYGIGGTIKEHNGSYDTLASALFVSGSTPIAVISYAETAYETALSGLKDYITTNATTFLTNKSYAYLADLVNQVVEDAIDAHESNDNNNVVFGDSNTFVNGVGVRNWPATIPFIGLGSAIQPVRIVDEALQIDEIVHHDGHYDSYSIATADQIGIARRAVRQQYTTMEGNNEVSRYYGWTTSQSADGGPRVTSYLNITSDRLRPGDLWVDGQVFKRFQVIEISDEIPSFDVANGALWLRSTDDQLMVKETVGSEQRWVVLPESAPGDISAAWVDIDLSVILNAVVFEVENRLYAATKESDINVTLTKSLYVRDSEDETLYATLRQRNFDRFARDRQINVPYASVYKQSDPFTWNYSGVDANAKAGNDLVNVWNPSFTSSTVNWAGYWAGMYLNLFGTSYPHREPWILQGFTSKPEWWDEWYADTTGTRVWHEAMWTNVVLNRIPSQFDAPGLVINTVVEAGIEYKVMEQRIAYVPVNISREVLSSSGSVIYELDALFPPYDSRLFAAENADIVNGESIGKPVIRRLEAMLNVNTRLPFSYGDGSPIEWQWLKSSDSHYGELEIAFTMQPIRFIDASWGTKFVTAGDLKINAETNKVFSHEDTIFHGDIVDGKVHKAIGVNQWYVNYNRSSGLDFKVSNFREMWTGWEMHLAYQFGCYINTRSLKISSSSYDMIREDFTIMSKKSPGFDSCRVDSLQVTVANYGDYTVRGGLKIPTGNGYGWSFLVDVPSTSLQLDYYGVAKYEYVVVDKQTGLLELTNGQIPWSDGDQVYLDTTQYAPYPLDTAWSYYVSTVEGSTTQFRVSRSKADALNKNGTMLRTDGTGVQFVGQQTSTFQAYGGQATAAVWKHNAIDKKQLHTVSLPYVVQGVQGLIDFVDGYAARLADQGIRVNDSSAREIDPNTGRLVAWQTEIERCITKIYSGVGKSNTSIKQYGTTYKFKVRDPSEDPDTFELENIASSPFQLAEEVYVLTNGTVPPGLTMNTPYYVIPVGATSFQLATTPENAYDNIGVNVTGSGIGGQYVGTFPSSFVAGDDYVEINPFRNNIWISTTNGVIANVFNGGSQDTVDEVTVYDQYGRPLPKGSLTVLREDKLTRVAVRAKMTNDVLVAVEDDSYNYLHIGGVNFYVDGYEHITMFNNRTTEGYLVYDPFVGMDVARLSMVFSRSREKNLRPSIGGYFYHNGEMIRNFEASIVDMRSYYDTYGSASTSDYLDYSRALLGYEDPSYLDQLNTPERSKFLFWKGMIQRKGSKDTVNAFINSKRFVDAQVDEFWAYKVSDFGDARQKYKPEINIRVKDSYTSDLRYEFAANNATVSSQFVGVSYADESRWVNPMEVQSQMNGNPLYFDAEPVSMSVDVVVHSSGKYIVLGSHLDAVQAQYVSGNQTITLINGDGLTKVNDRVYRITGVLPVTAVNVTGYVPAAAKLDPIQMVDKLSNTVVASSKVWDPLNGHHYYEPLKDVTYWINRDPVDYNDSNSWTTDKVGLKWVDSGTFGYVPYDDAVIFPEFNDRLARWGRLAQWADPSVYEWVRSTRPPEEYLAAVGTEEGDASIAISKRASGTPYTIIRRDLDGVEISLVPIETVFDVADQLDVMKANPMYTGLDIHVYVNGVFQVQRTMEEVTIDDIQYNFGDYVVLRPALPVGEAGYTTDYRYLEVVEADSQGQDETVYYFWARDRNVAPSGEMSAALIASKLAYPNAPYHLYKKFEAATGTMPNRYVQIVLRNIAQSVNDDNRYIAQFTRDFTLRDDLSSGSSALDLKNKHAEWILFREHQPFKITQSLWDVMTEALVGYELEGFDTGVRTPVPSLTYTLYDEKNGTTTRFGMNKGQAFVDREQGLKTIQAVIEDSTFDTAPVDKYVFLETHAFDTPVNIRQSLQYIFTNFSDASVNRLFFEVMRDALSNKSDFAGLFMTSWIALHGIKILETSGSVV